MSSATQTIIRTLAISSLLILIQGCATTDGKNATVTTSGFSQSKVVDIAPHGSACKQSGFFCIGLGAQWDSARPSVALLDIRIFNRITGISWASLNIDGEVHDLRQSAGSTRFSDIRDPIKHSTKGYSVPLDLIKKVANSSRTWVRVYGTDGYTEDMIVDGKEDSKAFHALRRFLATVEEQK